MSSDNEKIKESATDITCKPIDTIEEVLGYMDRPPIWAERCIKYHPNGAHMLRNYDVHGEKNRKYYCHYDLKEKFVNRRHSEGSLPKTLICHDMANGYHDDRFVDGTSNSEAYHFYDWAAIDMFCYFSHHFVTIPPLAWINAAHLHGVKVMGTLITEWADGEAAWEKILASPEEYKSFADSLVAITKYLRFEGWLLNVENKMSKPRMLVDFVRYLREQLHSEIPGAVLLWYDSVTINGDLAWQNGLNQYNVEFFRSCDGIFTNYSWKERDIAESAALAAAEGRPHDVYIGVDVWGRNFYGGGQFNTVEAVKVAFKHGCSLAIFAQAWTYEAAHDNEKYPFLGDKLTSGGARSKYAQFLLREKALWDTLWPYLNTRVPKRLPFKTSFCRGNGHKLRRYGEIVKHDEWHNLKDMEYQPNTIHGPHGYRLVVIPNPKTPEETLQQGNRTGEVLSTQKHSSDIVTYKLVIVPGEIPCVQQYLHDSFNGGSCLIVEPFDDSNEETVTRLFHCEFACENKLIVVVATKFADAYYKEQSLNVICTMLVDKTKKKFDVVLMGEENEKKKENLIQLDSMMRKVIPMEREKPNERDNTIGEAILAAQATGVRQEEMIPDSIVSQFPELYRLYPVSANELKYVQKYLLLDKPGQYVPIENDCSWKVRYFVIEYPGTTMTSISCRTATPQGAILLGHIGVCAGSNFLWDKFPIRTRI